MFRTRRTPKDRAAFPTELPSTTTAPAGVAPEVYASNRDILSVVLMRFMTGRLRAMYQAYDGDLTLCLVLGEIACRNTERFYDERRGYQVQFTAQPQPMLPCNALSISDVTGIPRETVRRKLAKLLELGWMKKHQKTCMSSQTRSAVYLQLLTTIKPMISCIPLSRLEQF